MNSYELSRAWFNFSFDNPELIKPIHSAIFFFAIEHCNRLGGKEKFGFPSQMTMEAIGVKNHQTYSKGLNDLSEWGFIKFIEKSKNQYSANIITISATTKNGKARNKALDKAFIKHNTKHRPSTIDSIVDIDKPKNQLTKEPLTIKKERFLFRKELLNLGVEENLLDDFLLIRKKKKNVNSQTAFDGILREVGKTDLSLNESITICVERSWSSFKAEWVNKGKDKSKNETASQDWRDLLKS